MRILNYIKNPKKWEVGIFGYRLRHSNDCFESIIFLNDIRIHYRYLNVGEEGIEIKYK